MGLELRSGTCDLLLLPGCRWSLVTVLGAVEEVEFLGDAGVPPIPRLIFAMEKDDNLIIFAATRIDFSQRDW